MTSMRVLDGMKRGWLVNTPLEETSVRQLRLPPFIVQPMGEASQTPMAPHIYLTSKDRLEGLGVPFILP